MPLLKLSLAILTLATLTACATVAPPPIADSACVQFKRISYAQLPPAVRALPAAEQQDNGNEADTDATVTEIQEHNARWTAVCEAMSERPN